MEDVLAQYARYVKPSHDDYIAPSKRIADIVIPWHKTDNLVAVDLIVGTRSRIHFTFCSIWYPKIGPNKSGIFIPSRGLFLVAVDLIVRAYSMHSPAFVCV